MKKLSLIVAMAVILTIGGVFATWTYPGGGVSNTNGSVGIAMTGIVDDAAAGEIQIISMPTFTIDQTATGNYAPIIVATGDLAVKYTKSVGSSKTNATITYEVTIETPAGEYKDSKKAVVLGGTPSGTVGTAVDGGSNAVLAGSSMVGCLAFGDASWTLPVKADYDTFKAAAEQLKIKITISAS